MGVGPLSSTSPGTATTTGTSSASSTTTSGTTDATSAGGGGGTTTNNTTATDDIPPAIFYSHFFDNPTTNSMNASAIAANDHRATQQYPGYPTLLHLLGRQTLKWMGSLNSDTMFRGMYER